jgi:hypothetical protein
MPATGVGQQDHERCVVAPVLSPSRDQALALQIPADPAEFLIGQLQVLQQPAAADMRHPASLGRLVNRIHDAQTVGAVPGDVGHRVRLPTLKPNSNGATPTRTICTPGGFLVHISTKSPGPGLGAYSTTPTPRATGLLESWEC